MERMNSGIEGLDLILDGGLVSKRTYMLSGSAGSGKTILSTQWLMQGIAQNEKCMYITLAETGSDLKQNAAVFGWSFEQIEMVDISFKNLPTSETIEEYQIFSPKDVENLGVWELIYKAIKDYQPKRLVIDSATQLRYFSTDEYQFRKHINGLILTLNSLAITTLLLYEPMEAAREASVALAVDGILQLRMDISPSRVIGLRTLQVMKFRGSDFIAGYHPYTITKSGIHLFPHIIEKMGTTIPEDKQVAFGLPELDQLLNGGLEFSTTTIISGPSGVGKSILASQLLSYHSSESAKGLLFAFEESIEFILKRADNLKLALRDKVNRGIVKIVRLNPMEIYPDEFLHQVREAIEKDTFNLVIIDSLRGYQLAMEEYSSSVFHVQNLVTYLHRKKMTTLLINEVADIMGTVKITELGISHLADNILLIRYADLKGKLIKVLCCLKKRLSAFEPELREISFNHEGIHVGEKLERVHGLLTSMPDSLL